MKKSSFIFVPLGPLYGQEMPWGPCLLLLMALDPVICIFCFYVPHPMCSQSIISVWSRGFHLCWMMVNRSRSVFSSATVSSLWKPGRVKQAMPFVSAFASMTRLLSAKQPNLTLSHWSVELTSHKGLWDYAHDSIVHLRALVPNHTGK